MCLHVLYWIPETICSMVAQFLNSHTFVSKDQHHYLAELFHGPPALFVLLLKLATIANMLNFIRRMQSRSQETVQLPIHSVKVTVTI